MDTKTIVFTAPQTAEFIAAKTKPMTANSVAVKMEYTVVSGGTERACIMALPNAGTSFPKYLGYCGVGHVVEIGEQVTSVQPGDRVLVYHGRHSQYNVVPEIKVKPIISRVVKPEEAPRIYKELCNDPLFPMGTVFDWR